MSIQTELWVEKYRPQTLKDIVGQSANLSVAQNWMESFKNQDLGIKKALLFSGPPGLGKTTLAHCLLREYGYRVKEYNASDIRSQKLVQENLNELINVDYVDKIFGKPVKKIGIIMDEVDGMMSGDRGGLAELSKFINPYRGQRSRQALNKMDNYWGPPIICICNHMDRKIQDLRKDCLEIKFVRPQTRELTVLLNRIVKAEKIKISDSAKKIILNKIAQGDFRRLVFFLQYLYQLYGTERLVDNLEVENSREIFIQKEQDLNMNESSVQLLNQKLSATTVMRVYNSDKSLLPLMIHENYVQSLNLQSVKVFTQLSRLQSTIQSITTGDLIDKAMYNYQCWYLQPVHGVFSCLLPSYYMNQSRKTTFCRSQFTTALSRYSIACTNQKTITQIKNIVSDKASFSTEQVHHFSRLISRLLLKLEIEKAVKIMRYYGLQITEKDSDLDRLVRVDRFRNKKEIPVRIKNQIIAQNNEIGQVEAKRSKILFLSDSKYHQSEGVEGQIRQLAKQSTKPPTKFTTNVTKFTSTPTPQIKVPSVKDPVQPKKAFPVSLGKTVLTQSKNKSIVRKKMPKPEIKIKRV